MSGYKERKMEAQVALRIFHSKLQTSWIYFAGQILVLGAVDFIVYAYVPFSWLLGWNVLQSVNILYRYHLLRRYLSALDLRRSGQAKKYLNRYFVSILLTGMLWTALVLFMQWTPPEEYFFIYSIIVMMTFASTSSIGPVRSYFIAYVFPMNFALFVDLLSHGKPVYYIAALSLAFSLYFSLRSSAMHLKEYTRILQDESRARRQRRYFEKLASIDQLTGLPNRFKFFEQFEKALERSAQAEERLLLFFLDLEEFKNVNDTLGHHIGDQVLKTIGKRLAEAVDKTGIAARLAGDEFVVIVPGVSDKEAALALARHFREILQAPIHLKEQTVTVTPSIGIVRYPDHGETPHELLQCADTAMYLSKRNGAPEWYRHDTAAEE